MPNEGEGWKFAGRDIRPEPARETLARMEVRFLGATGAWYC